MIGIESYLFQLSMSDIYFNYNNLGISRYLSTRKYSKSERYKTKQSKFDSFNLVHCSILLSTFDFMCNPAKGTQIVK